MGPFIFRSHRPFISPFLVLSTISAFTAIPNPISAVPKIVFLGWADERRQTDGFAGWKHCRPPSLAIAFCGSRTATLWVSSSRLLMIPTTQFPSHPAGSCVSFSLLSSERRPTSCKARKPLGGSDCLLWKGPHPEISDQGKLVRGT